MHITLVTTTFGAGGAERVLSIMANYWAEQGKRITLITLSTQSTDWYKLHPRVKRVGLDVLSFSTHIGQALKDNIGRIIRLRRALREAHPDVVISFLDTTNVLTILASWGLCIPVIVSERNDPYQNNIGWAWNGLRCMLYRHADAVVVQSHVIREWALSLPGIKATYVIPNPLSQTSSEFDQASRCHASPHAIVAMGRLVRQKGFDILIEAFGRCAGKHSDWSLVILGEGPERASLQTLTTNLGIKDRVHLVGQIQEPATILRGADLFVLSSRYEGFPNALLEAMACRLPVVSLDCSGGGPREIIRDGVDGVLVRPDDLAALGDTMDRLMADSDERRRLGARACEIIERFSVEKIMKMWDELVGCTWRDANQSVIRESSHCG